MHFFSQKAISTSHVEDICPHRVASRWPATTTTTTTDTAIATRLVLTTFSNFALVSWIFQHFGYIKSYMATHVIFTRQDTDDNLRMFSSFRKTALWFNVKKSNISLLKTKHQLFQCFLWMVVKHAHPKESVFQTEVVNTRHLASVARSEPASFPQVMNSLRSE